MTDDANGRRSGFRRLVLAVLAVVVAWCVGAGLLLWQARSEALAGLDAIEDARNALSPRELADGQASASLRSAERRFSRARRAVRNPVVAPLRLAPVLGRQVRSLDALTGAAAHTAAVAAATLGSVSEVLEADPPRGRERVRLLRRLTSLVNDAASELSRVDLGPSEALVGPLADARVRIESELQEAQLALERGSVGLRGLVELLEGPRSYLVLAANNAEMRAGSGMFLSAGVLEVRGGRLELGDMQRVSDIPLAAEPVHLDPDMAALWGWLEPNVELRHLGVSPRFDLSAELAVRAWEAGGGDPVDGVVAVDAVGLAAVVAATGPIEVEDRTVDHDEVVQLVLHDQYAELSAEWPTLTEEQAERREMIGDLAREAVRALDSEPWDVIRLAEGLTEATAGRHLLGWSRHDAEAAALDVVGMTGQLSHESVAVSLLNMTGRKLDWFVRMEADLELRRGDGATHVELRVVVENTTPDDAPPYLLRPDRGDPPLAPGEYRGVLAVSLPGGAADVTVDGVDQLLVRGPDGPTEVVGGLVHVPGGGRRAVTLTFTLPGEGGRLVVEPSARVPPIRWRAGGQTWSDDEHRLVEWPGEG